VRLTTSCSQTIPTDMRGLTTIADLIAADVERGFTLWPEWAWAGCHLDKFTIGVENRGRLPPKNMVGKRIAIHAGAHIGGRPGASAHRDGIHAIKHMATLAGWSITGLLDVTFRKGDRIVHVDASRGRSTIACGVIVATAIVSATVDEKHATGPWKVPGEYGWHFEDLQVLATPIDPGPGFHQGFWPLRA
jgi:hypothetical protein